MRRPVRLAPLVIGGLMTALSLSACGSSKPAAVGTESTKPTGAGDLTAPRPHTVVWAKGNDVFALTPGTTTPIRLANPFAGSGRVATGTVSGRLSLSPSGRYAAFAVLVGSNGTPDHYYVVSDIANGSSRSFQCRNCYAEAGFVDDTFVSLTESAGTMMVLSPGDISARAVTVLWPEEFKSVTENSAGTFLLSGVVSEVEDSNDAPLGMVRISPDGHVTNLGKPPDDVISVSYDAATAAVNSSGDSTFNVTGIYDFAKRKTTPVSPSIDGKTMYMSGRPTPTKYGFTAPVTPMTEQCTKDPSCVTAAQPLLNYRLAVLDGNRWRILELPHGAETTDGAVTQLFVPTGQSGSTDQVRTLIVNGRSVADHIDDAAWTD